MSKISKTVAKAKLLMSKKLKIGKINQTAQLLQKIRSGIYSLVVEKVSAENKKSEGTESSKKIPNKIAVEHSSLSSKDTLSGDKSLPKKSTEMKTVSSKKVTYRSLMEGAT